MPSPTRLRLDLEESLFAEFPRTQSSAGRTSYTSQNIVSDYMVHDMFGSRGVERAGKLFAEVGRHVVRDFTDHVVKRLINAGPHVLDIKYGLEYDPIMRGHVVRCTSPVLAVSVETLRNPVMRRYEPSEPDVSWRPQFRSPPLPQPTLWDRVKKFVRDAGAPLVYDGPTGAEVLA